MDEIDRERERDRESSRTYYVPGGENAVAATESETSPEINDVFIFSTLWRIFDTYPNLYNSGTNSPTEIHIPHSNHESEKSFSSLNAVIVAMIGIELVVAARTALARIQGRLGSLLYKLGSCNEFVHDDDVVLLFEFDFPSSSTPISASMRLKFLPCRVKFKNKAVFQNGIQNVFKKKTNFTF